MVYYLTRRLDEAF